MLRVKAALRDFSRESNLSVITEDGAYYSFNVDVYKRQALVRSSIRPGPFQRAGLVGRRAGAPAYPQ